MINKRTNDKIFSEKKKNTILDMPECRQILFSTLLLRFLRKPGDAGTWVLARELPDPGTYIDKPSGI